MIKQMILLPLGFFIPWLLLAAIPITLWSTVREAIQHLKQLHRIPCYTCRFYSGDHWLKCAVHPCDVASVAAVECSDYERDPNSQSFLGKLYLYFNSMAAQPK